MPTPTKYGLGPDMQPGNMPRVYPVILIESGEIVCLATTKVYAMQIRNTLNGWQ